MAAATSRPGSASRAGKPEPDASSPTEQDLAADVARLREDISRLADDIRALGRQSVNTAKRAAAEGVEQLRAQGEAGAEGLRANYHDVEQQLTQTVREKPITSLAVAAGLGFLFALITRK